MTGKKTAAQSQKLMVPVRAGHPVHGADSELPGRNRGVFRRIFSLYSAYAGDAL